MQIPFRKVLTYTNSLNYEDNDLNFKGEIQKVSNHHVELNGELNATLNLECNRCAKSFSVTICEFLQLKLTDVPSSVEDLDTIECLNGIIYIDKILQSELEVIKSDYNYCENCDSSEDFEIEI